LFKKISAKDSIQEVLLSAFDSSLPLSGGWAYDRENATNIMINEKQKEQLQFTFASMRSHIEMNLTKDEESRYGGINIKELERVCIDGFEKVTYEISAMLESDYARFINEYKQKHKSADFDISLHFAQRKEATLVRVEEFWFKLVKLL